MNWLDPISIIISWILPMLYLLQLDFIDDFDKSSSRTTNIS